MTGLFCLQTVESRVEHKTIASSASETESAIRHSQLRHLRCSINKTRRKVNNFLVLIIGGDTTDNKRPKTGRNINIYAHKLKQGRPCLSKYERSLVR